MDELKDVSIHKSAVQLAGVLRSMKSYDSILKIVQRLVCDPAVERNDMRNTLEEAIKVAGLETEIRNTIYHMVRTTLKLEPVKLHHHPHHLHLHQDQHHPQTVIDPLAYLKRAGVQWDRRVRKSLNAMCIEVKMPLVGVPRTGLDREEFLSRWEELSNFNIDLTSFRPVYAPKDLLEVLLSLKGPSKANEESELIPKWEFSHISMPVKNIFDLRSHFTELLRTDNTNPTPTDMVYQCRRVLASRHAPLCQQLLKKGQTPAPYRGTLWAYVLGSTFNECDKSRWHKLKSIVLATDHIVDKLVFKDIQLTASNDDQYFVFEDVLYQIMLCFSRDVEIAKQVHFESFPVKGKTYEGPPSGVVPFHGICMFAAPFCYLYDSPMCLYFTFRAFYIRYCHRLTTINTHPQGIVSLCLLFEKLLQTHEPHLWSHLRELQIQPIRVVFKWLMRAFSGHLPPDQLLILWDLILGYDSLEILAFFAIIVLSFRRESLMQVQSLDNIEAILADLSSIKVLPLIQLALSRD